MLTDVLVTAGVTKTLDCMAEADVPTYAYFYTHMAEHSFSEFKGGVSGNFNFNLICELWRNYTYNILKLLDYNKPTKLIKENNDINSGTHNASVIVSFEHMPFFLKRYSKLLFVRQ